MRVYDTPPPGHMMAVGPEDTNTGSNAGMWGSLENARGAYIVFSWGDTNGGTTVVTLDQALDSSGTGSKTLGFDKYYQGGQRLDIGTTTIAFVVGATVTGDGSGNTARIAKVSSTELVVTPITNGTTWTDGELLTTSAGASATLSGTGRDEDIWVEREATSDTFTTIAVTWTKYCIPVNETMLDQDANFNHFQLDLAQTGSGSALGSAHYWFYGESIRKYPGISYMGTQKMV